MEEQMKKRKNSKKRKRLKRKLASMTATVLVLTVGIMGTMAYLSTITLTKTNTFTGSKGISLTLTETEWGTDTNNDGIFETKGEGLKAAENYTPGTIIKKNPVLTNSTQEEGAGTEWVAIAVSYKLNDIPKSDSTTTNLPIPYSALKYFIKASDAIGAQDGIAFNSNWELINVSNTSGGELTVGASDKSADQAFAIFMYKSTLAKDTSTEALFTQLKIKNQDDLATGLGQLNSYVTGKESSFNKLYTVTAPAHLPNFEIKVIGAAIKNEYDGKNATTDFTTSEDQDKLTQLKTNLISILQDNIDEDARKLNGTVVSP